MLSEPPIPDLCCPAGLESLVPYIVGSFSAFAASLCVFVPAVPVRLFCDFVLGLCVSDSFVFCCSLLYMALMTSVNEFSTTTSFIRSSFDSVAQMTRMEPSLCDCAL